MRRNSESRSSEARLENKGDRQGSSQVASQVADQVASRVADRDGVQDQRDSKSSSQVAGQVASQVAGAPKYYTMMEVCREANMSYQTLKFYCNKGLVPNVKRDKNNRRIFDKHDMEWVKSLKCLKNCGLTINEMLEYLDLCLQGQQSIPKRKVMLAEKRENLKEELRQIQDSIDYIDWKQGFYDDVLAGRTEYFSNLLPAQNS